MNNDQNKHHGGGFVWGFALGAAVGALVSTKRGREILKELSDYGLEYLGNVVNLDDLKSAIEGEEEEIVAGEVTDIKEPTVLKKKRLFRGIRKKS